MKFKVAIRNNETGEVRIHDGYGDWDDDAEYLWTEGNYACDCNRADFFADIGGEPRQEVHICSMTLFSVDYVELEDGTRIEIEDPVDASDGAINNGDASR